MQTPAAGYHGAASKEAKSAAGSKNPWAAEIDAVGTDNGSISEAPKPEEDFTEPGISEETLQLAQKLIDDGDEICYDVAANQGQMFDNVKHMRWFVKAVAEEVAGMEKEYDNNHSEGDMEIQAAAGDSPNKAWKMRPPTGDAPKLLKERIGKTEWHSHDMSLAQHHPKCQCARCEPMGRPCDCKHCRALRVSQGKRAGWQNPLLKKADETALARVSKMETVGRQMVEKLREENSRKRNSMPEGFDFVGPAVSCSDWLTAMLRSIPNLMSMNIDYDLLLKELGKVWEKVKPGDDEEIPEPPAKMDSPLIVGE